MPVDPHIRILVVDDSGTMRIMFKQYLAKAGFKNLVMAVDGEDAIQKLQEDNRFDLVISDWNMPNKDGLDLLQWMRQEATCKSLPFIMATAQGDKSQQKVAYDNGASGHIAKPFDADELKSAITGILAPDTLEKAGPKKHVHRNGKVVLNIGHIQITDHLALGVLKHKIASGEITPQYFELETHRMAGWNPIQTALEKGEIDGAFVLAPIAMDLFAFEVPIQLILLAHKNGSGFIRNANFTDAQTDSLQSFYKYKVINIPHKMSIHNMLAHKFLKQLGLKPGVPGKNAINVRFEVVPPIKMPGIMKENENVGGFIVAEPICTNAVAKGIGQTEFISAAVWPNHPCCVVALRDEVIGKYPDAVHELTQMIVDAGQFIETHKEAASEIAVNFLDPTGELGLNTTLLKKVLSEPMGINMHDLFPRLEDLDKIQQYMFHEMGIGKLIDLEKFVNLEFASEACKNR
ncbi:MAG: multifunctional response regulator receiver/nitrate/sulfonate/bicarbonate ABC transporter substrate-binding protein [Deltaproteobacteria bacterium]|nr:MAG: multifunctional response regulator receiver/nitrate/sulfonate/bicarbonate ABC transporter substrate-binding protein [Deltaproteobacteria bacterium]